MLPQTSNHEPGTSTPLTETMKTHDVEKGSDDQHVRVRDYRKLAICSIVCGLSCLGIMSLIYSVKEKQKKERFKEIAEKNNIAMTFTSVKTTREFNKKSGGGMTLRAKEYSKKTLKWGIGAILVWMVLVIVIPLLLGLLSFLLTFID